MSLEDWACVGLIMMGILLFLYGANYYDNFFGWLGIFFLIGGIAGLVILYVYRTLKKHEAPKPQNP